MELAKEADRRDSFQCNRQREVANGEWKRHCEQCRDRKVFSAPPDFAPVDASWENAVDVCALKFFGRGVMFRGTRMLDETETVSTLNHISRRVSLFRLVVTLRR